MPTTRTTSPDVADEATAYARAVVDGDVVAGRLVKLACRRHLDDLKAGRKRGLVWKPAAAQYRISFYPRLLRHSKGEWAGKPVVLSPWQKFVIGSIHGWKRKNGTRRFRTAYLEVARKNGKSTMCAGLGLDLFVLDGEPGAEIYAAATKKDQARIIFDEAKRMVAKSTALSGEVVRFKFNMSIERTGSKFEPIAANAETLDGLNPSCMLVDELHKHKTRDLLDVLDTAVGARRQPLLAIITTAGDEDPESVYAHENHYATQVLEGLIADDSYFAYIATIDAQDRWDDPRVWIKANPNLGVSVKLDDLERQATKAKGSPPAQTAFKRLRLNVRTAAANRIIDMDAWRQNSRGRFDPDKLSAEGERRPRAWLGLDLSTKIDLTSAVAFLEADAAGIHRVVARFWMPADTVQAKSDRDKVPYQKWIKDGWVEVTEGNVIDYREIRDAVIGDTRRRYEVDSIAYDPWNATETGIALNDAGIEAVEFRQGVASYHAPTKELLSLIAARKLDHGDNPVLAMCMANLAVRYDANLNMAPHKAKSIGRIDGATALIMAIGRSMNAYQEPTEIFVI